MSKTSSRASSQETDMNNSSSALSTSYTPAANNCSFAQVRPTSEYSKVAYKSPGINYKQSHQVIDFSAESLIPGFNKSHLSLYIIV